MSEIVGVKLQINGGEDVAKTVGSIKQQLREAQKEVGELSAKFGATSKEAIEAAKRAAELKDAIGDAKSLTDAFNPDAKFKAFSASVAGVASGFAALQGAMGLFGTESEEVQKTLLKVQSAMAISQGLQAVGESIDSFKQLGAVIQQSTVFLKANEVVTKIAAATQRLFGISVDATSTSFKVLKGAIAATGIGLLVVALGEAISFMQNYTSATEDAAKAQADLNKQISSSAKVALDAETKSIESNTRLLVARAKAAGKSEEEIFKIEQDGRRLKAQALQRYYLEVKDADKTAAADAKENIETANVEALIAQENFNEAKRKKKEQADEDAFVAEQEALKKKLNAQYQAELDAYDKRVKLRGKEQQDVIDSYQTMYEREKAAKALVEEQRKKDEERYGLESEFGKMIQASMDKDLLRIQTAKNTADQLRAIKEGELKAEIEIENAKFGAVSAALALGQNLVGQNEALANSLFVIDKALSIGKIIVDTQREIAGYFASTAALGPLGAALGAKLALGAKIRAGASIATIAGTTIAKFKGGGTPSLPSISSGGNVSIGSPLSPTTIASNQVTLDQRSINAIGNKAIRAYVVESEITSAQQKIRRIQRQTTFG